MSLEKNRRADGWRLNPPETIGRNPELGICIDDPSISRSHCQILLGPDEGLQIRDLGSMNGTYVNGERIEKIRSIVPGDVLQLGSVSLKIEYNADTAPGIEIKKKSVGPMMATQPMRAITPKFTMEVIEPTEKKWWEFWKP
jgi:pSer/pThr/pTyr-binding forkhead associated (FHA) protein